MRSLAPLALAAASSFALADRTVVSVVVDAPSGITLELCQDLPIIAGCDSDTASVLGVATFSVDRAAGTVSLKSFALATTDPLDYTYTGTLSSVNASAPALDVFYDDDLPTAPVPFPAGAFTFPQVPVGITGTVSVTGSILVVGSINEQLELADFSPFFGDLAGSLTETSPDVWSLDASFSFDESTITQVIGLDVTVDTAGSLVIQGTGSTVDLCSPADLTCDAVLNLDDISLFIAAFTTANAAADLDCSGTLNLDDVSAFLAAFQAGCP